MTDKLFELLMTNPIISIIGGFVLALTAMILFREQIKKIIIKKYNLYTEEQVKSFGIYVKEITEVKNAELNPSISTTFKRYDGIKYQMDKFDVEENLDAWKGIK